MGKANILQFVFVILCIAAYGQKPFDAFETLRGSNDPNEIIEKSTLIIEGKIVGNFKRIYEKTSANENSGNFYSLVLIKPSAVLKGVSDSTKSYQCLIYGGTYTAQGVLVPGHSTMGTVQTGIYFINENVSSPSYNKPYENAIFAKLNWGITYGPGMPQEKVLQYLHKNNGLNAISFVDSSALRGRRVHLDTIPASKASMTQEIYSIIDSSEVDYTNIQQAVFKTGKSHVFQYVYANYPEYQNTKMEWEAKKIGWEQIFLFQIDELKDSIDIKDSALIKARAVDCIACNHCPSHQIRVSKGQIKGKKQKTGDYKIDIDIVIEDQQGDRGHWTLKASVLYKVRYPKKN